MGFWHFLSRGRDKSKVSDTSVPSAGVQSADYYALVPMAAIITGDDSQVAADMLLLASGLEAFCSVHPEWCEMMSLKDHGEDFHFEAIREVFTYWLAGYDSPFNYGAYIDWKEPPSEVVASLQVVADTRGFSLDLAQVQMTGAEQTRDALKLIAEYLEQRGYTLSIIDTQSDSYHLYLVPKAEYDRLVELGTSIGFKVSTPV